MPPDPNSMPRNSKRINKQVDVSQMSQRNQGTTSFSVTGGGDSVASKAKNTNNMICNPREAKKQVSQTGQWDSAADTVNMQATESPLSTLDSDEDDPSPSTTTGLPQASLGGGQQATGRVAPKSDVSRSVELNKLCKMNSLQDRASVDLIPHPDNGVAGQNWKLQTKMQLDNDSSLYLSLRECVRGLLAKSSIKYHVPWKRQDKEVIGHIINVARDIQPYFCHFDQNWALEEMIKTMLKNKRSYRKRVDKRGRMTNDNGDEMQMDDVEFVTGSSWDGNMNDEQNVGA
ncbi:hypothetical protein APHAL10511_004260 [Amanita phalloides]|nr:hypothetical protein APHAL10511_004260 [Amanita phalloides]